MAMLCDVSPDQGVGDRSDLHVRMGGPFGDWQAGQAAPSEGAI
jgi:hypothetical protein